MKYYDDIINISVLIMIFFCVLTHYVAPYTRLPGRAYTKRQHVWLTGANEVDSKTFSRAILAKVITN